MSPRKPHLAATPPNEGARRMVWIIATEHAGCMGRFAWRALMDWQQVQRLIDGDVVPGEDLCRRIGEATDDRVRRLDWQTAPAGGWFDAPADRAARDFGNQRDRAAA